MWVSFIVGAVSMGITYFFGCIGETLIEKGGNLNLGIPGIMAIGALGGAVGVDIAYKISSSPAGVLVVILGILFACIFAALAGGIYTFFCVSLQSNQNVTGLILTTFGVAFMKFVGGMMTKSNKNMTTIFHSASGFFKNLFGDVSKLGWFGEVFLSYGVLIYLAIVIAILVALFLNKTKKGLYLKAIGESPATADAQGINVTRYKYIAIMVGSALAGLGGLYYVFDRSGGNAFVDADIESFGWMAIAIVIFSMWKPSVGLFGSILFGALYILPNYVSVSNINLKLFAIIPYAATVLILVITSVLDAKSSQPPSSLGLNYFREER